MGVVHVSTLEAVQNTKILKFSESVSDFQPLNRPKT